MNYNGKEIKITCTLQNDIIEIAITEGYLTWLFNNINKAAKFLVSEYGGTKEEALMAVNNCIAGVVAKHLPESIKNIIARNVVYNSISDEIKDFVDVDRMVPYIISDERKELIVEDKLIQSKLLII